MTPLRADGPAQVFVAVDHQAGREVELTLFEPKYAQADAWAAFARVIAAATAAKISGLVLPRGVTRTAPTPPCCVSDLQMARGLDRHVEQGPTPWRRALRLCEQVAEIVERAHAATGAAHRALSSARCVVTVRGDVKVLDFGIAELVPGHPDDSPYRAPEQQPVGPRGDVYAIGVMLYELLTGQRATAGPLPRWSPPAEAHRDLEALVARATATDPQQRHADPAALRAAMRALLDADEKAAAAVSAAAAEAAEAKAAADEKAAAEARAARATAAERKAAAEARAAAEANAAEVKAAAESGHGSAGAPPLRPGATNLSPGTSGAPIAEEPRLPGASNLSERSFTAPSPPPELGAPSRGGLSEGTSMSPAPDSRASQSGSPLARGEASPASSGSRPSGSASPSRSYPTLASDPPSSAATSGSRLRGSTSPSRAHPPLAPADASSPTSRPRAPGAPPSRSHPTLSPSLSEPPSASSSSLNRTRLPGSASPSRSHPTLSSLEHEPAASSSSSSLNPTRLPGSASPSRSHPTLSSPQPEPAASSSSSLNRTRLPGSASASRSHPTLSSPQPEPSASSSSSLSSRPRPPGASPSRSHPPLSSGQAQAAASSSSRSRPRPPGAAPSRSDPTLAGSAAPLPPERTEVVAQSAILAAERARNTGSHSPVPAADKTEVTPRRSVRGLIGERPRNAATAGAATRRDASSHASELPLGDSTVIARAPTHQPTEELPVPAFASAPRGHLDSPTDQLPVPAFADARGRHLDPPTDRSPVPAFADATQVLRADDLLAPPPPTSDPDATRIWRRPPELSDAVEPSPAPIAPESTMMLPASGETVVFQTSPVPRARSLLAGVAGWSLRKKLLVVNAGLALVILFGVLAAVAC
ncbi:protein kinase domain-containing protein [Nannocystis exedens]|nr:protein kinase [Nannocystis exedens]